MNLVEIDVIHAQACQAGIDRLQDVFAGQAALVGSGSHCLEHFGRHDRIVTLDAEGPQRPPEYQLALARRIDIGGIEEVDAQVQRLADDLETGLLRQHPLEAAAEAHAAQADSRDSHSGGAQPYVIHQSLHRRSFCTRSLLPT